MDFVVKVLSWTGWIWTAVLLAVILPLLVLKARRRDKRPAGEDPEARADA
jgi:hypothetical protein